jgi:hypothetical protein
MEPAQTIITALGGPTIVSRELGVHRTRVSNWQRPRSAGGTGGVIPQRHIPNLIRLAGARGVRLEAADFFPNQARAS